MVVYPAYMGLTICPENTLSFRIERFLGELVCLITDSSPMQDSRAESIESIAAAELVNIRQSRQGDSDAYRRLIERHQERIGRIMWRFSRDIRVHEELVQDVFVEAYLSIATYREKAPFVHWLARIATRVGYRYWKQTARRRRAESYTLEEWDQVADESAEATEPGRSAALVHYLLGQLRPRDRLVLTLRYLEGCDVAETAKRTGWTKTMVKVQTRRARKKLEKLVSQGGKEIVG